MIARIEGVLESIEGGLALVRLGTGLTYEVLVSSYTASHLGGSLGQSVTLETLHFIESLNQGSSFIPRLAGFLTPTDRQFFELFTTTKGIGNKKALRALTLPTEQVAAAIADRDVAMLQSLPEVGRRTAETIVATLHGKVDRFVTEAAYGSAHAKGNGKAAGNGPRAMAKEALEVLLQLGENRTQAMAWIDETLRDEADRPGDVQDLVARVYRLKAR